MSNESHLETLSEVVSCAIICRSRLPGDCMWSGPICELLEHVDKEHPAYVLLLDEVPASWVVREDDAGETNIVAAHDQLFYLTRHLDTRTKVMYWALAIVGNVHMAADFVYTLTFWSDNVLAKISITETCRKFGEKMEDTIADGNCVGLPLGVLLKYRAWNDEIWYDVKISKCAAQVC